jgi:4-alpha-glucanotransferase
VFSLKTKESSGVGEFMDMIQLVDWCKANGLDVIQVLPLNDTSPFDNSPFSPISSFSLNPYLLSLRKLPNFDKNTPEMTDIVEKLTALNESERVDWKEVRRLKQDFFWKYYDLPSSQDILSSETYQVHLLNAFH